MQSRGDILFGGFSRERQKRTFDFLEAWKVRLPTSVAQVRQVSTPRKGTGAESSRCPPLPWTRRGLRQSATRPLSRSPRRPLRHGGGAVEIRTQLMISRWGYGTRISHRATQRGMSAGSEAYSRRARGIYVCAGGTRSRTYIHF